MRKFKVQAPYGMGGDQPAAVEALADGLLNNSQYQTLKGVTGSGKTFTMANIIERVQKPALVMSHNKTLAAQLYREFKEFFPENAVEYFVSYYDYYQPEAYVAAKDLYIEKDSSINDEIERMRLSAAASLMERSDVLVVATVSCIYGAGNPENFKALRLSLRNGQRMKMEAVVASLVEAQYARNDVTPQPGQFRKRGDTLEIYLAYAEQNPVADMQQRADLGWDAMFRIEWEWDEIASIKKCHSLTGKVIEERDECVVYPAKNFVMERDSMLRALGSIEEELKERVAYFERANKPVEAMRIKQRTLYDLEMMREMGVCPGIENYSRPLDGRPAGARPSTLIDYFPNDFILFMDESHVTRSQIGAMYEGDRSRKQNLVDFGFRLPSVMDNRPLKMGEFEALIPQTVYVSATPGAIELERSATVTELVNRPTGLLDPIIEVRPTQGQIENLYGEINRRTERGERSLVLTLTKKMAEDMADYFASMHVKTQYLHSEIGTIERVEILRDLRLGKIDVLIGVNLLREGIDLPEVSLIAIMDADKIGFLRSATSLIQIIGRAARNANGMALMYADKESPAMKQAIGETRRRRAIQEQFNAQHGITPATVKKAVHDLLEREEQDKRGAAAQENIEVLRRAANLFDAKQRQKLVKKLEQEMLACAKNLEFEQAAVLRDEIEKLKRGEF